MDSIWPGLGVVVSVIVGWLKFKTWRLGAEVDGLKKAEAERKAAEESMVADSLRRLRAVQAANSKPVDANKRDDFQC